MGPNLALAGVLAFMLFVAAIGAADVLRSRRAAKRDASKQLRLEPRSTSTRPSATAR